MDPTETLCVNIQERIDRISRLIGATLPLQPSERRQIEKSFLSELKRMVTILENIEKRYRQQIKAYRFK
jgi:hypothetical protein